MATGGSHPACPAEDAASYTAATAWSELTPRQRLAMLDLMQSTMQAEIDKHVAEINADLERRDIPARVEFEVRVVIDPNRDPRLER